MSFKRVVLVVAVLALSLPGAALADGFDFGFNGGVVDVSGTALTNASGSGVTSTLTDVTHFFGTPPASFSQGTPGFAGANLGTVSFATGNFLGAAGCGSSGLDTCYASAGSFFNVVANSAFAPGINAGDSLFTGSFVDVSTAMFAGGPLPGGSFLPGTGAIFSWLGPTFQCGDSSTIGNCFRLYGTISGTVNPNLLAALGLFSGSTGSGWVAQIDFVYNGTSGTTINIVHGDAQIVAVVPEPGTLALFGTGLIGLAGLIRRKLAA